MELAAGFALKVMPDRSGIIIFDQYTYTTHFLQNDYIAKLTFQPDSGLLILTELASVSKTDAQAAGFLKDLVAMGFVVWEESSDR